ncbi:30S ribosomal protein S18 [Candidatus Falkowbacteria bacterium CG_4_10_14_0_2_um_filter_48_10]|uniref:Small ribosomal subunit protein bS18 n=1 Tax=Candidatus Falkowbacteria bacterium CG23_combo_of_CG06-09_8_20_14_all_49_15 TaxID=1974572 RepID=A0A2G9ZLX0_9BACT|nr:MAG: 30S ribosomal protein S18 [Candidatus Falkowbacteria bacterium CG23_combo_of_CG06-09_8_20_14_all_49_15]PJA09441.1 MAG: 30S ribosomal protein S18 [Candidatus Falkowbacteria bacterium CG_4_10_14_0_2_um_filter_48_10]
MINDSPIKKVKTCFFCTNNINEIDYKDAALLRKFVNSYLKILPKKRTGVCSWHQRKLAVAVKRARIMALLPFNDSQR